MKTQTLKQIQYDWNYSHPFIGKVLFLMNKLRFSQDDAEKIAKLKFNEINDIYRIAIYNELNKN
jgi:hypothetical protein